MRIIYVTSTLPHGPGEPFIIPEILELMRRGHEILVVPMNPQNPRNPLVHKNAQILTQHTVSRRVLSVDVVAGALAICVTHPVTCATLARGLWGSRNVRILLKNITVFPKGPI